MQASSIQKILTEGPRAACYVINNSYFAFVWRKPGMRQDIKTGLNISGGMCDVNLF